MSNLLINILFWRAGFENYFKSKRINNQKYMSVKIIHSLANWLPQTMTWVYGQLADMNTEADNIIVCERVQNLDQFPMKKIYSLEKESFINNFFRRLNRKLGIRKHLPLLEKVISEEKPDILHSHFATEAYNNHKLAKKYNIRHVVNFYGVDVNMIPQNKSWRKRYKEMFKYVDLVLCEGPFMASSVEKLGCPVDKIKLQRLGVNLDKIVFSPRSFNNNEHIKFLIAGTFREKKGIPYALESLGLLLQEYDNFTVTVIGDATNEERDQKEKIKVLEVIEKYKLKEKIRMLGYVSHKKIIEEAYKHHIFISPSVISSDGDTEGGAPVAIIEMAASGMPVVSTTNCDIPFVLGSINNSILVEERNSEQLKNTILKLINKKVDIFELEKDNRSFIENNLSASKCSEELLSKYKGLL